MANAVIEKIKPIIKPVRLSYLNTRQSITGAPISLVNYSYSAFRGLTMAFFTSSEFKKENHDMRAEQLRENCYVSLPDFYDTNLISEVQEQFNRAMSNDALTTDHGYSKTLKATSKIEEYIPSIFKLIRQEQLIKIIQSYYHSPFKLVAVSATRLYPVPEKDRTPANLLSAIWHCDDIPTDVMHLAVYLHDVTPQHGPTRLVSRKRTKELMRMGYGRRWEIGIPQSVLEDRNYVKDLSSKAGTAHLMLPCLSLHRAGVPDDGLIRDSLFFSFRPGLEPRLVEKLSPVKRKMYPVLQRMGESWRFPSDTIFNNKRIVY